MEAEIPGFSRADGNFVDYCPSNRHWCAKKINKFEPLQPNFGAERGGDNREFETA
jgi:hypothetical protein